MLKYHARDLAAMPKEQLWALAEGQPPNAPIRVVFDDGELDTTIRRTIYSAYMWGMYVDYPKTPAKMNHHMGSMRVGMDTHLKLLNRVMWDCYDAYGGLVDVEELCRYVYRATNALYNDATYELEAYVQSISILDFIEVTEHPKVKKVVESTPANSAAIENYAYPQIKELLLDPKEFPNNAISIACRNGLVSMGQVLQTVAIRGAAADIDSRIFPHPIMSNFTVGLNRFHDSLIESRSAAKALSFTSRPLQEVEYFNRKMQLMAAVVEHLHTGDCGSTHYLDWHVHSGDLSKIAGKYYVDPNGKGLRRITEQDGHLIGKTLKLRSPLFCTHPDPQGVCAVCVGELALSVPRGTNPGHFAATAMGEQAAQTVLSTKHLDWNSTVTGVELSEFEQKYLRTDEDPNILKLSAQLKGKHVLMTISAKEAEHIGDVSYVDDVNNLQTSQISQLKEVDFTTITEGREETSSITVSVGSRFSSLSHEMLAYLQKKSWDINAVGNFVIDLKDWNFDLPLFELPLRHANMLDFMKSVESFMRASKGAGQGKTLRDYDNVQDAVRAYYELVTSQLSVNLAHLELLMKSVMIRSEKERDYRLPRPGNVFEVGAFDTTMEMRSLSAAMAYERHRWVLTNPASYLVKKRPDHIFDPLMEG